MRVTDESTTQGPEWLTGPARPECTVSDSLSLFAIRFNGETPEAIFTDGRRVRLPDAYAAWRALGERLAGEPLFATQRPWNAAPCLVYLLRPNDCGRWLDALIAEYATETAAS